MRILFLDQYAELGGAQLGLLDLLPGIREAGWEAHVALPGEGPLTPLLRAKGAEVHSIGLGHYPPGRKSLADGIRFMTGLRAVAAEVRALAERLDPGLIYVKGPRLLPAVAAARLRRPILFHAHSQVPASSGGVAARAALLRSGGALVAASRFLADIWSPYARGPVRVIYSGIEGAPAPIARRPSGGPRIGLIGRIDAQKAQKEFVLAAGELAGMWPEAEFVLCGDVLFGDARAERYKQEVLELAPSSLRYLGWRDDVYEVLPRLDVLVVPSANEGGIPRVVLEAFVARVPVLALASGAIPEGVADGENGFLLRSAAAPEIARRLRELIPEPQRLEAVAEAGYRLWQEKFTVRRYREEICAAISEVVRPSSRWKSQAESSPSPLTTRSGPG
jgi:glycosyltransferase involved in cell wall biosynthesis